MLHSLILKSPEAQASDIIRSPGLSHNQKPGSVKAQASTIIRSPEASSLRFKPAIIARSLGISHHRTGPTHLIYPEAQACFITSIEAQASRIKSLEAQASKLIRSPGFSYSTVLQAQKGRKRGERKREEGKREEGKREEGKDHPSNFPGLQKSHKPGLLTSSYNAPPSIFRRLR